MSGRWHHLQGTASLLHDVLLSYMLGESWGGSATWTSCSRRIGHLMTRSTRGPVLTVSSRWRPSGRWHHLQGFASLLHDVPLCYMLERRAVSQCVFSCKRWGRYSGERPIRHGRVSVQFRITHHCTGRRPHMGTQAIWHWGPARACVLSRCSRMFSHVPPHKR